MKSHSRGAGLAIRIAAVLLFAGLTTSCGNMLAGDTCPDVGPDAQDKPKYRNCGFDFLSARKQRSVLYSGNDAPRLYNGEPERTASTINASAANPPPKNLSPFTGYLGSIRVDYPAEAEAVSVDIANLRTAGAKRFDPDQRIRIDLNKATIDFMLQQLLGGALGVNYVAPEALGGSITFRTEEPIPKGQVLLVVRDLLSRNGLVMKFLNGVFHIGRPELITSLDATSAVGQVNEMVTRVVKLRSGSAHEVVAFARQLYPESITLIPSNVPRTIIVRAPPGDISQVEETLKSLSGAAISDDRVAIIPLRQSSPERVAQQLIELYRSRLFQGSDQPTIIALDRQQALLIATKDRSLMEGIRQMAQSMDRDETDEPTLRMIPLHHLAADEIAQRLATIFGSAGQAQSGGAARGDQSGRSSRGGVGDPNAPNPTLFPPNQLTVPGRQTPLRDEDAGAEIPPNFAVPPAATSRGRTGADGFGDRFGGRTSGGAASGSGGGSGQAVRIVADTRANAVLVFSTYAMFRRIRDVLSALDVPQSQVAIEATVVEVELNDQLDRGVQFFLQSPYANARSGSDTTTADPGRPGGFLQVGANFGAYRVDAVLSALQAVTTVKVISSPYLTVVDGKTARLVIGDQIPYTVRSQTSQNTGNVTVTQEVQIKDTGIILEVTPKINSNNSVSMKINQSVSTPAQSVALGNTQPVIATRSVDSNVLVQSGRTALLGGLIQDRLEKTSNGVPVVREVPFLGDLFKQDNDKTRRVELIVMITPRVSRSSSQIEDITRMIRTQLHTR